jgi:putative GTP pyrophosphokinase
MTENISQKELEELRAIKETKKYQRFIKSMSSMNLKYMAGMMETKTKIEILNEDFKIRYNYNPIKSIQTRLKTPESIIKKMNKSGLELNLNNVHTNIHDIAGIRIICKYVPDIHKIVQMLKQDDDLVILREKDYVNNPKESGYRSYHLIVEIPVKLTTGKEKVTVEIQIRTMSMDFWASLEHEICYKYDGKIPEDVSKELIECSKEVKALDDRMHKLKTIIMENNK